MSMIHWTEEARGRVTPLSAEGLPEVKARKPEVHWGAVRKKYRWKDRFMSGADQANKEIAEWTRAADALLSVETPPPSDTPDEVMAVLGHMTAPIGTSHTRLMIALYGLPRAIRVWLLSGDFHVPRGNTMTVTRHTTLTLSNSEGAFRRALMDASPAEYREARDAVAPAFAEGGIQLRTIIVRRFPNEEAWVAALADDFVNDTSGRHSWLTPSVLHSSRISLEDAARVVKVAGVGQSEFEPLLALHGEAILPLLYETAETASHASHFDAMARVLACIDSEEAANFFATKIGKKAVRKRAIEYFARFPARATALEQWRGKKTRAAQMALELLEQTTRATQELDIPQADESALPAILTAPPWDGGTRPRRKAKAISDLPAALAHEDHLDGKDYPLPPTPNRPVMSEAQGRDWLKKVAAADRKKQWPRTVQLAVDRELNLAVPPALRLKVWNEALWPYREHSHTVLTLLGEFGDAAIPGLIEWAEQNIPRASQYWVVRAITSADVAALAPAIAHLLRKRDVGKIGRSWMRRFPEAAIAGLLPAAVGKKNTKRRTVAEQALRWLAGEGHEARIRERAAELGKTGPAAIDEILKWDPLYDCPKKAPKLPTSFRPAGFVRPVLETGEALPLSAVQRIGEMLAFSPPGEMYAGLGIVKELCTERSLAEFSWSLASAWEAAGGDKRQSWMYYGLVHLADDEVVRRTTPALKNPLIVDVLGHISTEASAMELATIAYRGAKSASIYSGSQLQAEAALDRIAEAQGISRDALDDQITPTLGLDEDGAMTLDFGSRSFRVGFDEHLLPEIIDAKGKRRKVLPRGAKKDDPDKLAAAKAAWNELREDVGAIAMFRIDALERAMLSDRTWSLADFRAYWAEHRLMRHLARHVVWSAQVGDAAPVLFRVAEDGTFADAHDDAVEIEGDAKISVPHPLRWPDDTLPKFRELFDDYELLQPIHQLNRPAPEMQPADLAADTVQRHKPGNQALIRRGLGERGYALKNRHHQKALDDGSVVSINVAYSSRGIRYQIERLVDGERKPWAGAEAQLHFVLDELGLLKLDYGPVR